MKHAVKIELDTVWCHERIVTFNVSMPVEQIGFIRNFLNYHNHVVTTGRDVEGHPSFNVTMEADEILSLYYAIKIDEEYEIVNAILDVMRGMLHYHKPVERRFHLPFFPEELVKNWFGIFSWRVHKERVKKAIKISGYYMKYGGYDNRAAPEDIWEEVQMDIDNGNASYLDHCRFCKHQSFITGLKILKGHVEFN